MIAPLGVQRVTGSSPAALALTPSGKVLVTANSDPLHPSLTVLERGSTWAARQLFTELQPSESGRGDGWRAVSGGLALSGEHAAFVSEGNTGRVLLIDLSTGERRRTLDLNQNGDRGAFAGRLAFDGARGILYVADSARSRVSAVDTRSRQIVASLSLGGTPTDLALSPDRRKLYVAVQNRTPPADASGPQAPPSNALCVLDVAQPQIAKVEARVLLGVPPQSRLSGVLATAARVFVSDSARDSVTAIDAATNRIEAEIPIRIPGLDSLRGIEPMGMAYDESTGWLLVAEAGINAVGVLDTQSKRVLGHLPAGWSPTHVLFDHGDVYVANRNGMGAGPSARIRYGLGGSVSFYSLPAAGSLTAQTAFVLQAAGLDQHPGAARPLPGGIRHVVLIVKGNRSFDEVLGDVANVSNGPVMAAPDLARFGSDGLVDGGRRLLSLHHLNVTPNHHAIAAQWTFSDNFYADSGGEGLLAPEVFNHLAEHGVSVYQFAEDFDPQVRDTDRASRLFREIGRRFGGPGVELPQLVVIRLPNDRLAPPHPAAGFPYEESYLVDNDWALGRLLEYFSGTKWWGSLAVFVTEQSGDGGVDHFDARRTILLCAGPWARHNSVSHINTSGPGLWKTIFRLLGVPSFNLFDASAADLSDCFASRPDLTPYRALAVDPRVFDPNRPGAIP